MATNSQAFEDFVKNASIGLNVAVITRQLFTAGVPILFLIVIITMIYTKNKSPKLLGFLGIFVSLALMLVLFSINKSNNMVNFLTSNTLSTFVLS